MPQIISRAEAKALGLKRYFTGNPCKHGHVAIRLVAGDCIECRRRISSAFSKRARKTNKYRKYHRDWMRGYYHKNKKNPEYLKRCRALARESYARHRERVLMYQKSPEYRTKRNERARKYQRRVADLISVLRTENPELLKEFGL